MREGDSIEARQGGEEGAHGGGQRGAHPVLWVMAGVMAGFELMFAAERAGMMPEALGRWAVYKHLAFGDPIFEHVRAGRGFDPRALWTPVTHAFLHGGLVHLLLNATIFLALGNALVRAIGMRRFLATFALTAIGGAVLFGLMVETRSPLVGASGAIFGFLGMITAWQELGLRRMGLSRAPIWKRIAGLVALNVIIDFGLGGLLAWEAHLGGWIVGWLLAYAFPPRGRGFRIL